MSGVVHLRRERQTGEGLDISFGLCGIITANVTEDRGLVRCKLCRRRMEAGDGRAQVAPVVVVVAAEAPFVPSRPVPVVELGGATHIDARAHRIIERSQRGDDESERPRWRTLERAIEKTTAIRAGRSPIRNAWKVEHEARSEGAVRTEHGRDDVIEVDQAFARAFTAPVVKGSLSLTAAQARGLLEEVLRGYSTAAQVASDLTLRLGYPITTHQVGLVIRQGKEAMRERLERKGLIERRPARREVGDASSAQGERAEGASEMALGFDLESWKEIAALVGRSESTCKAYAARRDDPLPVYEMLGRVVARRSEVEAWAGRQARAKGLVA